MQRNRLGNRVIDLAKRRLFSKRPVDDSTIRLPWLIDRASFTDMCTRCGKCTQACQTNIIIKGDGGFPKIDFSRGECTFCYQCADACPEPLFAEQNTAPWDAKASLTPSCLAQNNVECRSCGDMCDTMAIQFKFTPGRTAQPNLNLDECNGCGACVAPCPTSAINVSHSYPK